MRDLESFKNRSLLIGALLILVSLVYLVKFFIIQVVDPSYRLSASNNVLRYVTQYPSRGLIYDRNRELVVANAAVYDLMVTPGQVNEFDTIFLCDELDMDIADFRKTLSEAKSYSRFRPSVFSKQVPAETAARIEEKLYDFPGFYFQPRSVRSYLHHAGAHMLGYVSEVSTRIVEENPYYKPGDYIGISGIEKQYETVLRGEKGVKIFMVDVHNRIKGSYENGRYDTLPVIGKKPGWVIRHLLAGIRGKADGQQGGQYRSHRTRNRRSFMHGVGTLFCPRPAGWKEKISVLSPIFRRHTETTL